MCISRLGVGFALEKEAKAIILPVAVIRQLQIALAGTGARPVAATPASSDEPTVIVKSRRSKESKLDTDAGSGLTPIDKHKPSWGRTNHPNGVEARASEPEMRPPGVYRN